MPSISHLKGTLLFLAIWASLYWLMRRPEIEAVDLERPPAVLLALLLTIVAAGLYGALHFGRRAWRLADTPS
ncbi:MAG: hypothetical protein R6X17_14065 [Candidatus Competibacteraceae bacterium]